MKKVLVVSYSRTGTTQQLANEIANALSADTDPITEAVSRRGWWGYLRSCFESASRGLPAIATRADPADYDLVVLGCPVWVRSMAAPMRTYLVSHQHALDRIACFCTTGGGGAEATLAEIRTLCGAADAPGFAARHAEVRSGDHRPRLDEFIETVSRLNGLEPILSSVRSPA